ncbi:MAG: PLP-dependent aspartate aminotransferase family protein [Spirochaetaceae bacterium]|jgi:cystathionine beta-lyase|nr:PLP-dependent aspartate aminotransferase family protein [Spirochaetaceae bacterium]
MKLATLLIHNGHDTDGATGALGTPVYQTSTFDRGPDFRPGAMSPPAERLEYDYARSGNPTRKALEDAAALLEGGAAGYAFSSGVSAIASVLGIFSSGDHIIAAEDIYGGSYRLLNTYFKRWGLDHTALGAVNPETIRATLRPETKALFIETPSNPLLKITDLRACCAAAREAGIITIVDNTFMTPLLQRPLELGADIVVHSATKFLGGHSDVLAGIAVTKTRELGKRIYAVQNSFGAVLGPWDCFLVARGLKTLKVRVEAQQATAARLVDFFLRHRNVEAVYYPGLEGHPGSEVHAAQAAGPGAVLSFKTRTTGQAQAFLGKTRLAAPAVSLGGVETIASYPVWMSHAAIPVAERDRLGISPALIRISAGLEDADDLIEDFDAALS